MAKSKIIKIISFLADGLKSSGLNISKIILFGSHASAKSSRDSDIDIVIVSKDFRNRDIFKRIKLIKDAEVMTIKKYMIPLDIITLTPEELDNENSITADFAKKGEIIYAA